MRGIGFILLLVFWQGVFAQKKIPVSVEPVLVSEKDVVLKILKRSGFKNYVSDTSSQSLDKVCNNLLLAFHEAGYLGASIENTERDTAHVKLFLKTDSLYQWIYIRKGNIDPDIISTTKFRERGFTNKTLYYKDLYELENSIIRVCENSGYPFASIHLDSVQVESHEIAGSLFLDKGQKYVIDSLVIKGPAEISDVYIRNYLGVKPGDPYNESLISNIRTRLREIQFLQESKPMELAFSDSQCMIYLYLEKRRSSQINGLVGVLPDEQKPGKVLVTGEFLLRLNNPFGSGELMELNWKSPKPKTQDLQTRLIYPFVISRFGLDMAFNIHKQDTTYLDVMKEGGVQYLLPRGNYLKVFVNNKTSSLLSVAGLENATELPKYADVNSMLYGIGLRANKLDYKWNPRKGYAFEGTAAAGTRNISKHPKVNPALYDSIDLKSNQYHAQYTIDFFIPLQSRSTLNIGLKGAHLFSNSIFPNEVFRIGGFSTLRGFDEESLFATTYDILKLEYRYILETNSYASLFWNSMYYENKTKKAEPVSDSPYGFGAGVAFDTKLGIFSVNYAVGKQRTNPIEWRSGKVSFGLLNNF